MIMAPIISAVLIFGVAGVVQCAVERIVGGEDAGEGEFPHQISMRFGKHHICGGSIIKPSWILTASHCVDGMSSSELKVVVGSNSLSSGGDTYDIEKIIMHSGYSSLIIINDIALLKLAKPITYSDKVKAINLPTENIKAGENLTLSGWGMTQYPGTAASPNIPDKLQKIQFVSVDTFRCKLDHLAFLRPPVTSTNLCAFSKKGEGACKGDSGGPLIQGDVQHGVVSWGIPCATGKPDVYTRVYSYLNWINEHTKEGDTTSEAKSLLNCAF